MKCPICGGTGNTKNIIGRKLTEQEYLQTCTTEQLIKWLSKLSTFVYNCGEKGNIPKVMYEEDWEYWLKQPHKEEHKDA